jgi:hypothetical protein
LRWVYPADGVRCPALAGQLLANGMGLGFAFNLDPLRGVSRQHSGSYT